MRSRYSALIGYIGNNYCGWQKQVSGLEDLSMEGKSSIQGIVENYLSSIADHTVRVIASGRTDAGVNATGQVIHFDLDTKNPLPIYNLFQALNSKLPDDIRVIKIDKVSDEFHAQQSAIQKQYSYYYLQGPTALPWYLHRACWIPQSAVIPFLDCAAMNQAAKLIEGEYDFKVFQAKGAKPLRTTVRTLFKASVEQLPLPQTEGFFQLDEEYRLYRIQLVGSGFLKQMVRSIAGTLKQVGEGKQPSTRLIDLVKSQNRGDVGPTAPPQGLWLERVWYSV